MKRTMERKGAGCKEKIMRGRATAKEVEGEGKRGWKKGLVIILIWGLGQFL